MTAIAAGIITAHIGLALVALSVVIAIKLGVESYEMQRRVFAIALSAMLVCSVWASRITWRWVCGWAKENGLDEPPPPKKSGQFEA